MYKPKLYGKVNEDLMYRLWARSGSREDLVVKSRYGMVIEYKNTPFGEIRYISSPFKECSKELYQ